MTNVQDRHKHCTEETDKLRIGQGNMTNVQDRYRHCTGDTNQTIVKEKQNRKVLYRED